MAAIAVDHEAEDSVGILADTDRDSIAGLDARAVDSLRQTGCRRRPRGR